MVDGLETLPAEDCAGDSEAWAMSEKWLTDLRNKMSLRIEGLDKFLVGSGCTTEQKHLDRGSIERDCWHHGYKMALEDVLGQLPKESLN